MAARTEATRFPYHGARLCVAAPGQVPPDGMASVTIAAGAFGSGEHETTASCLEALEGLPDLVSASVLDLGSGSGILALAALRLGAATALCVEPDAAAVAVARRNAERNGLAGRLVQVRGELAAVAGGGFDLALANLYADVLMGVAPDLVAMVRPGGRLVLSGIAWEQDWDVRQRYLGLSCELMRHRLLEEFSTLLLRRL